MELDEFRIIVRQNTANLMQEHAMPAVGKIMQGKTMPVVQRIKRSLSLELIFALLFIVFITLIIIKSDSIFIDLFGYMMLGFCISFIYYLRKIYKKIRFHE